MTPLVTVRCLKCLVDIYPLTVFEEASIHLANGRNVQIRPVFFKESGAACVAFALSFRFWHTRGEGARARDRLVRLINAATADRNLDWRN